MVARKLVGQNDMMLSSPLGEQRWTRTHVISKGSNALRAVFLTECEVNDPARFGYLNGSWWKLEEADFEAAPRTRAFKDELGSYTLIECTSSDPDKIFYNEGTYWKRG